jgi:DNA polymerase/3'-5' exonuclease PolX
VSSATHAIPLYLADSASMELQRILQPACERVSVAGSVRRRKDVVHDLELVVVPKVQAAARPGELLPVEVDWLEDLMQSINRGDHHLIARPRAGNGGRAPAWGPRYKKLVFRHQRRFIRVDLWITSRARYGAILAIRTGDSDFSRLLVTQRLHGGAMPFGYRQANGELQHCVGRNENDAEVWEPLYTPEERDFFDALGLPVLVPEQRTEQHLRDALALAQQRTAMAAP